MQNIVSTGFDRIVITGIGMITAIGHGREAAWRALQQGRSGVGRMHGVPGIPDGWLPAAMVNAPSQRPGEVKNIPLCVETAAEALEDAGVRDDNVDRERFGCFISGIIGDTRFIEAENGWHDHSPPGAPPWEEQWMPHTTNSIVSTRFGLQGPTASNVTACASGTIGVLAARRAIEDDKCDIALAGASEVIHPVFAAGFHNMKALAQHDDPTQACRPFDVNRSGFVMGEGAAMLVLERLSHARRRGATIYAEVLGGGMMADAHHLTGVDANSTTIAKLIQRTLSRANLVPSDIDYINAHGTGTQQNDLAESRGVRTAFGAAADDVCMSSVKSMIGHLVSASGAVEIGITALALRDGFAPPTINLTRPDPACDIDCIPMVGRRRYADHALKLSLAFGGHMVAVALGRWDHLGEARAALPLATSAAA